MRAQYFENPALVFFIQPNGDRVLTGEMFASDGVRAVVDFGAPFGIAMPLLSDVYAEEDVAYRVLERMLQRRIWAVRTRLMALEGTLEAATVSVLSD